MSLASAESPEGDLGFTMLDKHDRAKIKYQRVNEVTGREVAWKDIVKGFEVDENEYVVVTPEDFKRAAPKASRTIEITDFVARDEIDPMYFERPYVLEPLEGGQKGYALLREAMRHADRVGIAKVVLHTREHLAALIPVGQALVLETMRFKNELRPMKEFKLPAGTNAATKVNSREVKMAETLIDGMTSKWDPAQYHDEYRDKLRKWIEQRAKSGGKAAAVVEDEEEDVPGPYNIMELLKKSVEGKKGSGSARRGRAPAARRKAG
jgi:DNA end-binding protein Ku